MTRLTKLAIAGVLAVACILSATATAASAAPKASAAASAPLAAGPINVQVGPGEENNTTVVIIGITIDPSIKLPVRVRIPVPPAATVAWAGEILGGDPNADPQAQYTLHDGAGGAQYAEFTMSKSRIGQIDTYAAPLKNDGKTVSTQVTYVQSVPSTSTIFSVRLPANISNVKIDPTPTAPAEKNTSGESLYLVGGSSMATGAKQAISIAYSLGAAAPASAASSQTPVFVALGIALVAVLVALGFVVQRGSGPSAEDDQADANAELELDYSDDWDDEAAQPAASAPSKRRRSRAQAADADADADGSAASTSQRASDDSDDPFDSLDVD
jgi:hypothetical protein